MLAQSRKFANAATKMPTFRQQRLTHMLTLPCAKINIGLYVTAKRPDGYHDLQTVFYPIPLWDQLEIKELDEKECKPFALRIGGRPVEGDPGKNLVVRVYDSLKAEFDLPPLDIFLYKNIPTGAGLGGGSSDAAFMMKALNEKFALGLTSDEMERRVAAFGADCAFFVRAVPAYATGIGDRLAPIALSLKGMHLALVKPADFVSTKEAYADIVPRQPATDLRAALAEPVENWRHTVSNDFEAGIFTAHPAIAAIKRTLYDMGAVYASMSGSGSTVFGLFRRPVEEAARVFPDCFVYTHPLSL